MSYMERQKEYGYFWALEGVDGTVTYVPEDVITGDEIDRARAGDDSGMGQYSETRELQGAKLVKGLFTRESAPGYMDCTPWEPIKLNKTIHDTITF